MNNTVSNHEERKNNIRNAAAKVFVRLGYDNATIELIAKEVPCTKGNLYNYYSSKDDIYFDILFTGAQLYFEEIECQEIEDPTLLPMLKIFIHHHLDYYRRETIFFKIYTQFLASHEHRKDSKHYQTFMNFIENEISGMIQPVLDAQEQGYLQFVPARSFLLILRGFLENVILHREAFSENDEELTELIFNFIVHGIKKEPSI